MLRRSSARPADSGFPMRVPEPPGSIEQTFLLIFGRSGARYVLSRTTSSKPVLTILSSTCSPASRRQISWPARSPIS